MPAYERRVYRSTAYAIGVVGRTVHHRTGSADRVKVEPSIGVGSRQYQDILSSDHPVAMTGAPRHDFNDLTES